MKRRRVTGKESDCTASASATEVSVDVPVMVNSKDLSEGDVLTMFKNKNHSHCQDDACAAGGSYEIQERQVASALFLLASAQSMTQLESVEFSFAIALALFIIPA